MNWFGPSKKDIWRQLSEEIGAQYVEKGWRSHKVVSLHGPWTVTLDTYTVSAGHSHVTYTRMRAPFVNRAGFRFTVYRKGVFSDLGKKLGMQDIEVGDPQFDEMFIIKGNSENLARELFADATVRQLLAAQPSVRLDVKDSEGAFGPKFPPQTDELLFQVRGVIKDKNLLKSLFDLFGAILDRMERIGQATKEDPGVSL